MIDEHSRLGGMGGEGWVVWGEIDCVFDRLCSAQGGPVWCVWPWDGWTDGWVFFSDLGNRINVMRHVVVLRVYTVSVACRDRGHENDEIKWK